MQEDASFKVHGPEKLANCLNLQYTDSLTSNSFKQKDKNGFSGGECNVKVVKGSYKTTFGYLRVDGKPAFLRNSILEKRILYY